MKKNVPFGVILVQALFFVGCSTVTETGRKAFNILPESQLASMASTSFRQLKSEVKVSQDRVQNERLNTVGRNVLEAAINRGADLPPREDWEFVVFDDKQVNAFAMPGGKVGFYTGIIDLFENDDEMAIVMGHEIGHVAARHGNERMSQQVGISLLGVGLGIAMKDQDENLQRALIAAYGLGAQYGVALPFSRKHESEADHIGLIYAADAGYDPRVAVGFWQKMAKTKGAQVPEFLSTHPSDATRIANLNRLMPEAMKVYNYRKSQRAQMGPVDFDRLALLALASVEHPWTTHHHGVHHHHHGMCTGH